MDRQTQKLTLAGLFAALTCVGAFLRIPLGAMSFTLQFFFTAMAGVTLGPKWGAVSQTVYVALGLVGLPVFTQGGGLGYLLQPSFGFLLGLIPAAAVIGALAGPAPGPRRTAAACLAGLGVLYLIGLPYMALILRLYLGKTLGFWSLLRDGMLVYLPGDFVKIGIVAALSPVLDRVEKRK